MKISYNWLKDYVDFDLEPAELARILTDTGLEVEGIETFESVKGGLKGVIVGEVLTCEKHPNADKLSVTTVDIGADAPLPIVCGAPNVAAGQKVAVAVVGSTLFPSGATEGFAIKKAKIRGEVSEGMICADDELGIGRDHSGIRVLPAEAKPGDAVSDYLDVYTDTVFEIGLTPNRIDGASHIGVARDIAAYLKQHHGKGSVKKPSVESFRIDNHDLDIKVEVVEKDGCPRYSGITITGLEVKESPAWLKYRLLAIGQTPINNVVDITNYVLHECGQPLHAFDASSVTGNRVIVKTLPEGTRFTTLDEKERVLTANDLMICNTQEPMCIGGVFGGLDSGVKQTTRAIFLESATFDPVYIRKTSRHHVLNTDASLRFERGTDPNNTIWALKRAALLISEIASGKVSSDILDEYPVPVEDSRVEISFKSISRLIGKSIPANEIRSILESLDIRISEESKEGMVLLVPPYRVDVKREADIVEEILRIYGFNSIGFDEHVHSTLSYVDKPDKEKAVNVISDMLSGMGFLEIKSNSLTKEEYFDRDDPTVVSIYNPLSQDLSRLRNDLLTGGLEAVAYNFNRKKSALRFYEFGNCYSVDPGKETNHPQEKYHEEERLGIFIAGDFTESNWVTPGEKASFYHIKTITSTILKKMGVDLSALQEDVTANSKYSEGLDLRKGEKVVATFGLVDPSLAKNFDIKHDVYAADIRWGQLLKLHGKSNLTMQSLPKFPEVKRDLSLMLDRSVLYSQLKELAFSTERKLLKNIELFDIYEGDKIDKNKKSYALSFTLLDENKTLTDKQIDKVMQNIAAAFEKQLGAIVRGNR